MTLRARDGHESFDSELQNDPINNENASFTNFISGRTFARSGRSSARAIRR